MFCAFRRRKDDSYYTQTNYSKLPNAALIAASMLSSCIQYSADPGSGRAPEEVAESDMESESIDEEREEDDDEDDDIECKDT